MELPHFEFHVRPSDSVRESKEHDGIVLFDLRQGLCFSINAVGGKIWRMMKTNQPLAQIIDTVVAEFKAPQERVSCDVMAFVELLNEEGLLLHEVNDGAVPAIPPEIGSGSTSFGAIAGGPIIRHLNKMNRSVRSIPSAFAMQSKRHAYEAPQLQCERGINCALNRHAHNALRSCPAADWRVERIRTFLDAENGGLGWNIDRISAHLKLGLSGPGAAKLFGVQTGTGFREYATKRRLIRASRNA